MYGKPRPIDTTLYAIREKVLHYYVDMDSLTRAKIKGLYIKTESLMKPLVLKDNRYVLTINPIELKNIQSSCPYQIKVVYKDGKEAELIKGQIVIVR